MTRALRYLAAWTSALLALAGLVAACVGAVPDDAALIPQWAAVATVEAPARRLRAATDALPAHPSQPAVVEQTWQVDGDSEGLHCPTGVAVDAHGTLTVVDAGKDRLVRLSNAGRSLGHRGRSGVGPGEFRFVLPPDTDLGPGCLVGGSVAADADGSLVVADLARVQRFDAAGRVVATWATAGPAGGRLSRPAGVAVDDRTGHVYLADAVAASIHKYDRDGRWLLSWGSRSSVPGSLANPVAVAVDGRGRVYVADRGAEQVQAFDADGQFLAAWGGRGGGPGEFFGPRGVAVDRAGRVYVVDAHRVQVFTDAGVLLADWPVGGDSPASSGGIAVDDRGGVFVTDTARGLVLHFRPHGPWPAAEAAPTPRPMRPLPTPAPTATATFPPLMTPTDR
jgi:DNA-binding beta-propeller fold protein YncE